MRLTLLPVDCSPAPLHRGVTVDVTSKMTLTEVIALGRKSDPRAFAFHEDGTGPDWWSPVLIRQSAPVPLDKGPEFEPLPVTIAADGRAIWHQDASVVSMADLERTIALGVVDARSDIIGYELLELGGNGEVHALLDLWQTFMPWIHDVAGAVLGLAVGGLYAVVSKHWRKWRERKCRPIDLVDLSQARHWSSRQLAEMLEIGAEDAHVLLEYLGFPPSLSPELLTLLLTNRCTTWIDAFPAKQIDGIIAANPKLPLQAELDEWRSWRIYPVEPSEDPPDPMAGAPEETVETSPISLLPLAEACELGAQLKRLRVASGLTQRQLAEIVCATPQHLSRIERGQWGPKSLSTVEAMAETLGFHAGVFLWPKRANANASRLDSDP